MPLVALLPSVASATLKYHVYVDVPGGNLQVSIRVEKPGPKEVFSIPGWTPGFYVMQKFEEKISDVKATDGAGTALETTHEDGRTWTVKSLPERPLVISYKVAANDIGLGFFGASVARNEAYINGPAVFMYVDGRRGEDTALTVDKPSSWQVATAMDEHADAYTAQNYDEMADEPVQMGVFDRLPFEVLGIPFQAVFQASAGEKVALDEKLQVEVLRRVSTPAVKLFGGAPFKRYVYFFHLTPAGFQGGLEHRSGTVIAIPNSRDTDLSDLAAHEFFHAWNVKQIRPAPLGPFDYTSPQRTANLWFAEGVTDYYSKLLTYRSGVHDLAWLLEQISDQVNSYQAGRTRLKSTVEDASRQVWENGGFSLGDLDYYNKGLLAGLLFDIKIRETTHGKRSLDDVMRLMYSEYRLPQPGYGEDGISQAISTVAGTDLSALYNRLIRSTSELPYEELKAVGLNLVRPRSDVKVALGYPVPTENASLSALRKSGVRQGDEFLSFNVDPRSGEASANFLRANATVAIRLPLTSAQPPTYEVIVNPKPDPDQSALFRGWAQK